MKAAQLEEIANPRVSFKINIWNEFEKFETYHQRCLPFKREFSEKTAKLLIFQLYFCLRRMTMKRRSEQLWSEWLEHFFSNYCTFELSFFLPQGTWVKVARNIKKPWTGQEAVSRFIPYALYRTQLKERILAHQAGISECWDDAIQDLTRHQILKTILHRWMPVFSFAIL